MDTNGGNHDYNDLRRQSTALNGTETPSPRLPRSSTMATPSTSTAPAEVGPVCDRIEINYDVAPAVICGVCFVFGVLYCFFGYRFFKATMFMTGFIFGSMVTYLICLEENLLPMEGKIGVALTAGVLCGLITMLVQYVGLFMTGFHLGLLLAVASLVALEQCYHPHTKWIPIGILFGTGLVFALLILYFQKGLTILGTSVFGSALLVVAFDYYIEMFMMVDYVWERVKAEPAGAVCWFSWLILAMWPATFLVGVVTQGKVTGKGFDHHDAIVRPRRRRKLNIHRSRDRHRRGESSRGSRSSRDSHHHQQQPQQPHLLHSNHPSHSSSSSALHSGPLSPTAGAGRSHHPQPPHPHHHHHHHHHALSRGGRDARGTREEREFLPTSDPEVHSRYNRYRHLYQIRRVNGDVVSQSFIQNIHHKLSPELQAITVRDQSPSGSTRRPGTQVPS